MARDETLWSYSRLRGVRPKALCVARDASEVAEVLARATREGRRVTIRAGGRSFDDQALNDDVVVDFSGCDRVLSIDHEEVTVEAGARWGAIVDATLERGLLPHVLVTTSGATAGGTLSANCLSRSTPRYGHTGDHVRSFRLLTVGGETLECSREKNYELFRAVIGGFGLFGVVTEVTYDLHHVGERRHVKTVIERVEGLEAFTERLALHSLSPAPYDAVYSVFSLAKPQRGAVLRSEYTTQARGKTLHLYAPDAPYRPLLELLFLSSRVGNALCHASYEHVFRQGTFISDLRGYTFCMESNERARTMADGVGVRMRSFQPSYLVPREGLLSFLNEAARIFAAHRVYPALLDALYLPANDFLLSAANGLAGFCTSFTFAGLLQHRYERIRAAVLELNDVCIDHGGRLSLIKDVHASKAQIRRMYGHALEQLATLKSRWDATQVLMNDFFARLLDVPLPARTDARAPATYSSY